MDGFLRDPEFPRHLPVVRFVDETLQREMAQYVLMHVLIVHRQQRAFDAAQAECAWRQRMLAKPSRELRIGILGMGDIGARLLMFDFQVSGWSRSRKQVPGVASYAGPGELSAFLGQCDILVCMLPLTPETEGILNAALFAGLPKGAWLINVARGGHCNEADLIAALDSGQLAGAVLDCVPDRAAAAGQSDLETSQDHRDAAYRRHHRSAQRGAVRRQLRGARRTREPFPNRVDLSKGY